MFLNIIIGLASFALNLVLAPKPQDAKPAAVDDFNVPTADESREIPWLFGTKDLTGPNVHWWGHFLAKAIKGARRYGLFGPRQTTGHNYFLGMHMVLCHGVADAVYRIKAADTDIWKGACRGGRVSVKGKPSANSGTIEGEVDIEMGAPNQGRNDYLAAQLGSDVPAFRGVVGAVLRRPNMGESPYLAPWSFLTQRIYKKWDGSPIWYPAKAGIGKAKVANTAIYFALDTSGSMAGTRLANMKAAIIALLQDMSSSGASGVDIRMVSWSASAKSSIERRGITTSGYNDLISWVNGVTTSGGTDFAAAVSQAATFFAGSGDKARNIVFVTDGLPEPVGSAASAVTTLNGIANVSVHCFNIDLSDTTYTKLLDNTPGDGVPVVSGGDPSALQNAISAGLGGDQLDMNPIHIIRECLTDPIKGMGYHDSDMGSTWVAAADKTYAENFGLTLLWQREETIEEFCKMVQSHIDAYVYVDRRTGKFEIKLIRDDYDLDDLMVVTDDDFLTVEEIRRRQPAEAVTSVTVKYFDRKQGKDGSYVAHDPAEALQRQGTVSTPRHYPGVQTMELASRLAERDLHALSVGFADGRVTAKRRLSSLNPGTPFRLVSERLGFSGEVMRAVEMKLGDGRRNAVRLNFVQDVFRLDAEPFIEDPGSEWVDPSNPPTPVERRLVHEMPYRELVQAVGEASAASMLAANPNAGLVQIAGGRPTGDSIQAIVAVDEGSGYEDISEPLQFAPTALVDGALGILATSLTVRDGIDLDLVTAGMLAAIGGEFVRVDAIAGNTLTIGRGCLDTVPKAHADGEAVIFFDDFNDTDSEVRSAGGSIGVKLKTVTGKGELDINDAPEDTITFASRAIRPYPPKGVTIAGQSVGPVDATGLTDIPVAWFLRNRLTETTPLAWTAASQTPEAGQTTIVEVLAPDMSVLTTHAGLTGTGFSVPVTSFAGHSIGLIRVGSERDGFREWQAVEVEVLVSADFLTLGADDLTLDDEILIMG